MFGRIFRARGRPGWSALAALWAICLWASFAAGEQVPLRAQTNASVAKIATRSVLTGQLPAFQARSDEASVELFGRAFLIKAAASRRGVVLWLDADGDGQADKGETGAVTRNDQALLNVSLPVGEQRRRVALLFDPVQTMVQGNVVQAMAGRYRPVTWMVGRVGRTPIRLLDEDLSGTFSQDGSDAICIGAGEIAQPLVKRHCIGGTWYELTVSPDGASLEATELADLPTGVVTMSGAIRAMQGMVFTDGEGTCFDILSDRRLTVPAGQYRFLYGRCGGAGTVVPVVATSRTPAYPVQAGKLNTLRLGEPLSLDFPANFSGEKIHVVPRLTPVGAGGEAYIIDTAYKGDVTGKPRVDFYEGSRRLTGGSMEYG